MIQNLKYTKENIRFYSITPSGAEMPNWENYAILKDIVGVTIEMYSKTGFEDPWISYVAVIDGEPAGCCSFKSPPENNTVEIAYFTFPEFEGRGIATRMAMELIAIAKDTLPDIDIIAQTLPEENASTSILKKLGFIKYKELIHPEDGLVWEWKLLD